MPSAHAAAVPNPPWLTAFARGAGWTALGVLGVATLAYPSGTRLFTWPWSAIAAGLAAVPMLLWLRLAVSGSWRRPHPIVAGGLALLAVASTASAWASPYRETVLARCWPLLGTVALAFVLHDAFSAEGGRADGAPRRPASGRAALVIATLGAALALASLGGWAALRLGSSGPVRNAVPFGHSTQTGGALVLLLPWLALQAWQRQGWARAAWTGVALAAVVALSVTGSRAAALALAAVIALAALAILLQAPWPRRRKLALLACALALATAGILANPRLRGLVLGGEWSDAASESNRQRSAMLAAGARLGAERPWLGWGPGSVPLAYPRVRAGLDGGVANILQLHSTPAQLWATLGGLGLIAGALIGGGVLLAAGVAVLEDHRRPELLAAATSLAGYAIVALTDHQLDQPAIALLVVADGALLTAAAASTVVSTSWLRRGLLAGLGLALAGGPALATLRDLRARAAYEAALAAGERDDAATFVAALDRATALAPHDPFYQHQAAMALHAARQRERDPARQRAFALAAARRLESSLAAHTHQEFAHFNLGWLRLELGEPAAAARHFLAAAQLTPDRAGVYFGLGLALEAAGRREDAVRAFALEWIGDPRQLTSPAWEVPALAALRPTVRTETLRLLAALTPAHPSVASAAPWLRWWLGAREPLEALRPAPTAEMRAFAAALPAILARQPVAGEAPWAQAYRAWREAGEAGKFLSLAGGDAPLAAALQRRAVRWRDDFRAFLAAPTDDEPALVHTLRHQRLGYGVLALHPDGPPLFDLYVVQENRATSLCASGLFPAKGWLPARQLLALLPDAPR